MVFHTFIWLNCYDMRLLNSINITVIVMLYHINRFLPVFSRWNSLGNKFQIILHTFKIGVTFCRRYTNRKKCIKNDTLYIKNCQILIIFLLNSIEHCVSQWHTNLRHDTLCIKITHLFWEYGYASFFAVSFRFIN